MTRILVLAMLLMTTASSFARNGTEDKFMTDACNRLQRFFGAEGPQLEPVKYFKDPAELVGGGVCFLSQEHGGRGASPMYIPAAVVARTKKRGLSLNQLRPLFASTHKYLLETANGFLWAEKMTLSNFEAEKVVGCAKDQILFGEPVSNLTMLCEQLEERGQIHTKK